MSLCPCGSGRPLDMCCGPLLEGAPALTAESLVRARYTAYVLGQIDFIEKSGTVRAQKEFNRLDTEHLLKDATWNGLEIHQITGGGETDEQGSIELTFRIALKGKDYEQRELALFRNIDGRWFYESSTLCQRTDPVRVAQIGRNDPCSCGSGKKFKKCCGA